eukprot:5297871-Pyramimonas_sp.AAC.1
MGWILPQFGTPESGQLWTDAAKFEGAYDLEHGAGFGQVSRELHEYERDDDMENWGPTHTVATGGQ